MDDGGNEAGFRWGFIAFPVGNRLRVNADLVGNLSLEEFEVQPSCPNMIT
jgi:hypothetical protein